MAVSETAELSKTEFHVPWMHFVLCIVDDTAEYEERLARCHVTECKRKRYPAVIPWHQVTNRWYNLSSTDQGAASSVHVKLRELLEI